MKRRRIDEEEEEEGGQQRVLKFSTKVKLILGKKL